MTAFNLTNVGYTWQQGMHANAEHVARGLQCVKWQLPGSYIICKLKCGANSQHIAGDVAYAARLWT